MKCVRFRSSLDSREDNLAAVTAPKSSTFFPMSPYEKRYETSLLPRYAFDDPLTQAAHGSVIHLREGDVSQLAKLSPEHYGLLRAGQVDS